MLKELYLYMFFQTRNTNVFVCFSPESDLITCFAWLETNKFQLTQWRDQPTRLFVLFYEQTQVL